MGQFAGQSRDDFKDVHCTGGGRLKLTKFPEIILVETFFEVSSLHKL